jgi:dihydroflavonol-4-reductase
VRSQRPTPRLDSLHVERVLGDVRDAAAMREAVRNVDAVIHLAAIASWSEIRAQADALNDVIVGGTRNVLAAAKEESPQMRVVFVSSAAAINASKRPEVFDESAVYSLGQSTLRYSVAKHHAEEVAQAAAASGQPVIIVNPCEVYGPEDDGLITAGNIIELYKGPLALVPEGGTAVAHVEDIARGIVQALEKGRPGQRYILGGDNLTVKELARLVLRLGGKKRWVIRVPNWLLRIVCTLTQWLHLPPPAPLDVLDYAMLYWFVDCSKAKRELGYSPRSAVDVLQPTVRWLLDTGRIA